MRIPGVRFKAVRLPEAAWDIGLARRRESPRSTLVEAFVRVALEVYGERPTAR